MLFKAIELPSDEPVAYVGKYVLHWRDSYGKPEFGFREATPDEIGAANAIQVSEILARIVATEAQLRGAGWNAPVGYDSFKATCFSAANLLSEVYGLLSYTAPSNNGVQLTP